MISLFRILVLLIFIEVFILIETKDSSLFCLSFPLLLLFLIIVSLLEVLLEPLQPLLILIDVKALLVKVYIFAIISMLTHKIFIDLAFFLQMLG